MPVCPQCGDQCAELAAECAACGERQYVADDAVPEGDPVDDPLLGRKLVDKYVTVERLNEGAMGTIYRAVQLPVRRDIALKVLHTELEEASEHRQRFEREARAVSKIRHPHVVTLHDFGFDEKGNPYMAMEHVDGVTLEGWLAAESPDLERVVEVFRQLLSSLAAAHDEGIVHRDLKPDNILVTESSDEGDYVNVLDFGIARMVDESADEDATLTEQGEIYGTPYYMAPEQALGRRDIGPEADVYAAGILLFHLLTGHRPFDAESALGVLKKQCDQPIPDIDPRSSVSVPRGLDRFVEKAVEKEPQRRFEDAREMLEVFEAYDDPDRSGIIASTDHDGTAESEDPRTAPAAFDETMDGGIQDPSRKADVDLTPGDDAMDGLGTGEADPEAYHDSFFDPEQGAVTTETERTDEKPPSSAGENDRSSTTESETAPASAAADARSTGESSEVESSGEKPDGSDPDEFATETDDKLELVDDRVGGPAPDESSHHDEHDAGPERDRRPPVDLARWLRAGRYWLAVGIGLAVASLALFVSYVALAAQWSHLGAAAARSIGLAPVLIPCAAAALGEGQRRAKHFVVAALLAGIGCFGAAHFPKPERLARELIRPPTALPKVVEHLPGGAPLRSQTEDLSADYAGWLATKLD